MHRALYLERPDLLDLRATPLAVRPGAVLLSNSPVFPGGGGQLADQAVLVSSSRTHRILGVTTGDGGVWHHFAEPEEIDADVRVVVDAKFRSLMCELHTLAHVLNALVYETFGGALLTGAQLSADGTFRVDFDLPGVGADRLRELERPLNEVIARDLPVRTYDMPYEEARAVPGMFRSKTVAPPPSEDGSVRIVEIVGLDRQACGGTHLASTGRARSVRILKVDNKGRQNRRMKLGVAP
jgi:misacylated tRNA(Ala) deacylase